MFRSFDDNNILLKSRQQNKLNIISKRLAANASLVFVDEEKKVKRIDKIRQYHKNIKCVFITKYLKIKGKIRQNR